MKLTIVICIFLLACSDHSRTTESKQAKPLAPMPVIPAANPDEIPIRVLFDQWKEKEIRSGRFVPTDSCNWEFLNRHPERQTIDQIWAIPDSSDVHFAFADLNEDHLLDGLVTFTPRQCDGGNGSMWVQISVLIVSESNRYIINDTLTEGMFEFLSPSGEGFIRFDSISPNRLHGIYFEFREGDGHCCPSIRREVRVDYHTRKVTFLN